MQAAKHKKNNLVHVNMRSGTADAIEIKKAMRDYLYPQYPEHFSSGAMVLAARLIPPHAKRSNVDEILDAMLFYVECGTQFTCDYGDIDEGFYEALEGMFEDFLKTLKKTGSEIAPSYKERIFAILAATEDMGWGYHDQLTDLAKEEFPEFFDRA